MNYLLSIFVAGALVLLSCDAFAGGTQSQSTSNQHQSSTSASGANNQGNTQQFISNGASGLKYGGEYSVQNVPSVSAPAITASYGANINSCLGSFSQSANGLGFGESTGMTIQLEECIRSQNARLQAELGHPKAAKELTCGSPEVYEVYKVLAQHGLEEPCLMSPSDSYMIPGGAIMLHRHADKVANKLVVAKPTNDAILYPASERLRVMYENKKINGVK